MDEKISKELIDDFLKELNVFKKRDYLIIPYNDLVFELHVRGNLVNTFLQSCFTCPVDCYKKVTPQFRDDASKYINNILKKQKKSIPLSTDELVQLSKVAALSKEPDEILDLDEIRDELKSRIHTIKIVFIGLEGVGKSTIFEQFPGDNVDHDMMVDSFVKENKMFPPLMIQMVDLGKDVIETITSSQVAPLTKKELDNVYMFVLVTDSTSKNVMNSKPKLMVKLSEINPHALVICIANKQDNPKALNHETVENILDARTYPLTATDPKSHEEFVKIIWETVLLRIEQMKEHECPFI